MTINTLSRLSIFIISEPMVNTSMSYHVILGLKHCFAGVAYVLCTVHVHHMVDMSVFIISYNVPVVTFDYLFIQSFVLLHMMPIYDA